MKNGRPLELDDLKAKKIVDAIAAGNSRACAAASAGIHTRTLHEWLSRGIDGEARFIQFAQRVREADSKAERKVVDALVARIESGDINAVKFWLKTRRGRTWRELEPATEKEADLSSASDDALWAAVDQLRKERAG